MSPPVVADSMNKCYYWSGPCWDITGVAFRINHQFSRYYYWSFRRGQLTTLRSLLIGQEDKLMDQGLIYDNGLNVIL